MISSPIGRFSSTISFPFPVVVIASDNITLEKSSFLSCENLKKVTILSNNIIVKDNITIKIF